MVVYAAIAGMLALMGFFAWYASLENPELEKVELDLIGVEIGDVNKVENTAEVKVTFLVTNPGEKTFTIALINYDLFADAQKKLTEHGLNLHYLATWWDILEELKSSDRFDEKTILTVDAFLNDPVGWSDTNSDKYS